MTFQRLINVAQSFLERRKYLQSSVCAQIAAHYASYNHTGEFLSPQLEQVLRTIGKEMMDKERPPSVGRKNEGQVDRVLHVLTAAKDVGGDTRFVWRWILRDSRCCHSVALTQQMTHEVPRVLLAAVSATGGTVHVLDGDHADVIERANALRGISKNVDAVVLHIYPEDVVPIIAFADNAGLPPIIFVAQADHQFWTGVSVIDLTVHLREAGERLSIERRGMRTDGTALLPIPLEPVSSRASRFDARKKIGFSQDMVVLLSVARAIKYEPITEPSFCEAMVPILERHRNAVLLVVGPEGGGEWNLASEKTEGRIRTLGQRSDTQVFYEAADIYLDSFPFASNTSLLEAGSYGLPLVSYYPYSEGADVLSAGAPGFERTLLRSRSIDEFGSMISKLIEDAKYREEVGAKTREEIASMHCGEGWNQCLQDVYQKIASSPARAVAYDGEERCRVGELDVLLNRFYSRHVKLGWVIGWYARHLPFVLRVQLLGEMLRVDRSFSFSMFLPTWVGQWLGSRMKGWRRVPILAQFLSPKG